MIIIGSGLLLAIGLLVLLWQAILIAVSLLKIAYYLAKGAVYLVVLIVCAAGLAIQYVLRSARWLESKPAPAEPAIIIDILDDGGVSTIELLRNSFRRLKD
jgi:hypothetical protein